MDRFDEDGAVLLAPLRDVEPGPGSGVSIRAAVRAGRRHGRRRALATLATAVSVTALCVAGVPALLGSLPDNTTVGADAAEFSIALQAVAVGSAGGYTPVSYRTGRRVQVAELARADGHTGAARVTAYAPGHQPHVDTGTPATDVNGRSAYWQPDPSEPTLAVRGPGGVWVIVSVSGTDIDLVERAHRVGQSVRFGANIPVTLPFTARGELRVPGTEIRPVGVLVRTDRPAAQLLLAANDRTYPPMLAVGVDAEDRRQPNDVVHGVPAAVERNSVTLVDSRVTVSVPDAELASIGGIPTLKDLATTIVVVPFPADRANWVPCWWT
jgi:hypothetical protein